jgi:hypothetical protein
VTRYSLLRGDMLLGTFELQKSEEQDGKLAGGHGFIEHTDAVRELPTGITQRCMRMVPGRPVFESSFEGFTQEAMRRVIEESPTRGVDPKRGVLASSTAGASVQSQKPFTKDDLVNALTPDRILRVQAPDGTFVETDAVQLILYEVAGYDTQTLKNFGGVSGRDGQVWSVMFVRGPDDEWTRPLPGWEG